MCSQKRLRRVQDQRPVNANGGGGRRVDGEDEGAHDQAGFLALDRSGDQSSDARDEEGLASSEMEHAGQARPRHKNLKT